MAANTYKVEYSKTGRAKCKDKDCKENIDQGVLRIAKCSIDTHFSDGDIKTDWFHAPCWFNAQKRTRPGTKVVESTDDLEGFDGLKSGDKETIKDLIAGKKGAGAKKKAKKDDSDDDDKPKKKKAAPKKKKAAASDDEDEEEEEKPKKKRAAPKKKKAESDEEDSDDEPKKKKKKAEKKGGGGGGGKAVLFEVDSKFWEYTIADDHSVTYRWGKIGSAGQTKEASHPNAASAQKEVDKLVRQKEKKGYEQQ